jgi:SPP1 family predicted phage head-tail adaptor
LESGRLRSRITIQQDQPNAASSDGAQLRNWVTLATVWADGGPLTGRELWAAREVQSEITHRWKVRYGSALADLTGTVRILYRDRVFHLADALNIGERNIELQLDCTEAPDSGRFLVDPQWKPILDPLTNDIIFV